MSDTSEAAKAAAEYDVGDTKSDPALDYAPEPAKPEQPAADQPKDDVRPRNPDGTFAKAEQKPAHSARRLKLADELGIAGAAELSAEELDDEIVLQTRLLTARSKSESAEKHVPPEPDELDIELSDEEFDPKLVKMFNALKARAKAQDAELKSLREVHQARDNETATQQVDRTLAELDAEFYGKGALHTLKSTSAELGRRQAVVNEAKRLAGADATRQQIIDRLEAAHKSLFGREPVQHEDPDLAKKKDAWSKGGLARPTARESGELPKGEKRATVKVAELMRARNGHATEEDGIPE